MTLLATLNVHRGAVLPYARVVVLLVPTGAALFYYFVIRPKKRR